MAAPTYAATHGHVPWASLLACASAEEAFLRGDDRPCTGQGLTQAGRLALENVSQQGAKTSLWNASRSTPAFVDRLSTDLNGEPYRADEFGFAWLRLAPWLREGCERVTPALSSGDLGSASALTHLALAAYGLRARSRPDAETRAFNSALNSPPPGAHLVLASSDDRLRAAFVLAPA